MSRFRDIEARHFPHADDAMLHWHAVVAWWIPLYLMCFLYPQPA